MSRTERVILAAICLAAAALALTAACGPLWLDEVWTLERAAAAPSAGAVLTLHVDNAHWVAALWARLAGTAASEPVLRLPSIAAHALLPVLLFLLVRPAGRRAALLAALFSALAAPLVRYGSELRGYAPALAAVLAVRLGAERGRPVLLLAAGPAAVLSHLTAWLPLALAPWFAPRGKRKQATLALLPSAALAVALLVGDVRHWRVPGGESLEPWRGFLAAGGLLATGRPCLPVGLLVLAYAAYAVLRRRVPLPASAILFLPPLALTALGVDYAPPRYALVPLGFLLPDLFATPLGGRPANALGLALLALLPLHLERDLALARLGRCPVAPALREALRRVPEGTVTLGADFDLRHEPLVRHHAGRIPGGERLRFLRKGEGATRFLLLHRIAAPGERPPPFPRQVQARGTLYVRLAVFESGSDEGWSEALYGRAERH